MKYGKIFKILMWVLLLVSVAILVWGFSTGFETNNGNAVDVLLYWTYVTLGIALAAALLVGLFIGIKNDPKSLLKLCLGAVAVAVVCALAYVLAPGNPAVSLTMEQPNAGTLKLTDTILNLTYFAGGAAILSIIVGEIVMAIKNR